MKKALDPHSALRSLAARLAQSRWSAAGSVATGMLGAHRARARSFDAGLTVALTLDRPVSQAPEACLLLASTPEACDDALYLADDSLWLLRRFPERLTEVEFDLLLKQQLALAALLAARDRAPPLVLPIAGRYA